MHVVPVEAADDPRLADYTDLTDVALRRVREPAEGLFVAEGEKVILRAVASGYRPRSGLCSTRWLDTLRPALAAWDIPVYVAAPEVLRDLTGFRVHRGALAAFHRRDLPAPAALLDASRRLVVLEDLVDHTNVGAVFRSAAALGMDAVLLSPGCADPLYRRSVKVSMGAALSLPWTRADAWPDGLDAVRARGFATLALTPDPLAEPLPAVRLAPGARIAILIGTEGDGLSAAAQARCDRRVRIPMSRGIDSLNAAAASAVAFYALAGG